MVTMMMQKHRITWHAGVVSQMSGRQDDGCQVDDCPEDGYQEVWSVPAVWIMHARWPEYMHPSGDN